jgi:hypothetical protein
MKIYSNIFRWLMIAFSGFILYVMFGIYMNSSVCLTYQSASIADIQYVNLYSQVIILYIILMIVFLVIGSKRK